MPTLSPDIPKVEIAIVEMTNAFRNEQKLRPVAPNSQLTSAARAYAAFLARSNLFSHTADGREAADRVKAAGYSYCLVAENLSLNLDSRGFETRQLAKDAVEGWKSSPGHRKNMLAPHVTETGVAVAKAAQEEKYLSVQLFGRPQSLTYRFQIENYAGLAVHYAFGEEKHTIAPRTLVTHTACVPGSVAFERAGEGRGAKSLAVNYEARDGAKYVVRAAKDGSVKVDLSTGPASGRQTNGGAGKR